MKGYSLSPAAKADIREIWAWIAADDPVAATRLGRDILDACKRIAGHPALGGKRPKLTRKPVHFLLVRKNYWIVYDPDSKPLQIMRVIHAARDITAVLAAEN